MVFTPPGTLIIRSREYGDGLEYDSRDDLEIIPDHYVKRIWRKVAVPTTAAFSLGGGRGEGMCFDAHKSPSSSNLCLINLGNSLVDAGLNMQIQYINKSPNSSDRSVAYSSTSNASTLTVRYGENGATIFKVEWNPKNIERSRSVVPYPIVS